MDFACKTDHCQNVHAYYTQCVVFVDLSLNRHWRSTTAPHTPCAEVCFHCLAGVTASLASSPRTFPATGVQNFSSPTCLWALMRSPHPAADGQKGISKISPRVSGGWAAFLGFHLAKKTAPQHLLDESFPTQPSTYSLRRSSLFLLPKSNTSYFQSSPIYFAAIFSTASLHTYKR